MRPTWVVAICVGAIAWSGLGCTAGEAQPAAPASNPASSVRTAAAASAKPSRIVLTPTTDPSTSQRISWSTSKAYGGQGVSLTSSDGATRFVPATRQPKTSVRYSGTKRPRYTALLTDLEPGATYTYRVVNSRARSAQASFTTANPATKAWKMLGFGDTQVNNRTAVKPIIDQALRDVPDAALMLQAGDVVDRPYKDKQWSDFFAAMGTSARARNWLISIGNHEQCVLINCNSAGAQAFRSYFDWPDNGYPGQGQTWFYTDYQDVRIVVLDSFGDFLPEQADFLDRALGENPNTWSIVLMHASPFASRPGRTNPEVLTLIEPIIEAHNVDLVLTGHDHSYVRGSTRSNGPVYAISDSGPKFYPTDYTDWTSNGATPKVTAAETSTYQVIEIDGKTLRYRAVVALKGPGSTTPLQVGQTLDEFTITKSGTTKTVR